MTCFDSITLPHAPPEHHTVDAVSESHGVTPRASRMYARFYGQQSVLMVRQPHAKMLSLSLSRLTSERAELAQMQGTLIYTKTQTHNTPAETNWLRSLADEAGLTGWEVATLSMTNCASALAAIHAFADQDQPLIIVAGEKAFHPTGNRLAVGLLGEAPAAALFLPRAGRRVRSSCVKHLPQFFRNPDDMDEASKAVLPAAFELGLEDFLTACIDADPAFFAQNPVLVPYNLNVPLVTRVLTKLNLQELVQQGHSGAFGHTFCSDPFLNMVTHPLPTDRPLFVFCAGMGVTYAAVSFDADSRLSSAIQTPTDTNPKKEIL